MRENNTGPLALERNAGKQGIRIRPLGDFDPIGGGGDDTAPTLTIVVTVCA